MNWFFWAILSAVCAGATAVLAKVGVQDVNSNLATAIRTAVVLVFSWTLVWLTGEARGLTTLNRRTVFFLVLSGIATGLSWLCYFHALQLGEASRVAPIDKLSVVFAICFAALFLGETFTWSKLLGGLLILAGAAVLAIKSA